jgi:hypothetical protein
MAPQRIEPRRPESLVAGQPHGGLLQGSRRDQQVDDAAVLGPADQAGLFQHAQMLHEARQRHAVRLGQRAHRSAALLQRPQHGAAGRVRQCGEYRIEHAAFGSRFILNHRDKYQDRDPACQGAMLKEIVTNADAGRRQPGPMTKARATLKTECDVSGLSAAATRPGHARLGAGLPRSGGCRIDCSGQQNGPSPARRVGLAGRFAFSRHSSDNRCFEGDPKP